MSDLGRKKGKKHEYSDEESVDSVSKYRNRHIISTSSRKSSSKYTKRERKISPEHDKKDFRSNSTSSSSSNTNRRHRGKVEYTVNILVPAASVGGIIGKGGVGIKELSEKTKTKILVRDPSRSPYPEDRVMTLIGELTNIQNVEMELITRLCTEQLTSKTADLSLKSPDVDPEETSKASVQDKLQWLLPNDVIGLLIGKGGCGVSSIVEKSGVSAISIAHAEEMPPNSKERLVTITSSSATANQKAKRLIQDIAGGRSVDEKDLKAGSSGNCGGTTIMMPSRSAGYIIGVSGSMIKQLAEESGARLQIGYPEEIPLGIVRRKLRIQGSEDQVSRAQTLVEQKLREHEESLSTDLVSKLESNDIALKMLIAADVIGSFIGVKGCNVREISEQTQVHIRIVTEGDWLDKLKDKRILVLTGRPKDVLIAQRKTLVLLHQDPQSQPSPTSSSMPRRKDSSCLSPSNSTSTYRRRRDSKISAGSPTSSRKKVLPCSPSQKRDSHCRVVEKEGGSEFKRKEENEVDELITMSTTVESIVTGAIIGSRGNTVRKITQRSGCKMAWDQRKNKGANQSFYVTGSQAQVEEGMRIIRELVLHNGYKAPLERFVPADEASRLLSRPEYKRKYDKIQEAAAAAAGGSLTSYSHPSLAPHHYPTVSEHQQRSTGGRSRERSRSRRNSPPVPSVTGKRRSRSSSRKGQHSTHHDGHRYDNHRSSNRHSQRMVGRSRSPDYFQRPQRKKQNMDSHHVSRSNESSSHQQSQERMETKVEMKISKKQASKAFGYQNEDLQMVAEESGASILMEEDSHDHRTDLLVLTGVFSEVIKAQQLIGDIINRSS